MNEKMVRYIHTAKTNYGMQKRIYRKFLKNLIKLKPNLIKTYYIHKKIIFPLNLKPEHHFDMYIYQRDMWAIDLAQFKTIFCESHTARLYPLSTLT